MLTPEEGAIAVQIARRAIEHAVSGERFSLPEMPPAFAQKRGVFVTIKQHGMLRGCIGLPYPVKPLAEAVVEAAISAATEDPRFPPVSARELGNIILEVTVLTLPAPLEGPPESRHEKVKVGTHGLIVSGRGTSGLLLPQVPLEWRWDSREFLDHTCMKAGLPTGCWKKSDITVLTFEGQIFGEQEI
ncbi:putative acr [hydrocarbon metagenome]|uniref:Putative acr n=1 Tax=hydrocarbon metagenome TaxID=938273 RepID=A0A0W8FJE9_9ZZZZ